MTVEPQTLIFDADDTLWENNVLFERVLDDFVAWLRHPTLDIAAIRGILADIQRANVVTHGYGSAMFLHSLREVCERLRERPVTAEEHQQIHELAADLTAGRVELLPGVAATLDELGGRHRLLLLTKGHAEEQQRKVEASTLASHFTDVHIVTEKDADTYRWLVDKHALTPSTSWMIGNSPKSDILPARQAGMNAVFIPNAHTWELEHIELDHGDRGVLRLDAIPELLEHF